jgi:sugar phosphate isomerase/epimerase
VPRPKIAIQLASLRQPFKQALHTAARLGARGVQIDGRNELRPSELSQTGLRQIRKLLDDLNLQVAAVRYPTRRGYDDPEELDRRVAGTTEVMRMAHRLGAQVIVNHVGIVPEDPSSPRWNTMIEALTLLGRHGQHEGATLAATTGGQSGEDLARLLAALPSGTVGVDLHPGNLVRGGFSVEDAVRVLGPHILHVHASDAVRDLRDRRGIEVALGRGTVDIPTLLAMLDEQQYRGWLTIERLHADDPLEEIGNAVQYLQNMF